MKQRWKVIAISLLMEFLCLPAVDLQAERVPMKHVVTFVTDRASVNSSAFFVGDRGYLLTVLGKPDSSTIGKTFTIAVLNKDDERRELKAAVIDVHPHTGVALLRLTDMKYPFDHSLIASDNIGDPYPVAPNEPLVIYYGTPEPPFVKDDVGRLSGSGMEGGHLKIEGFAGKWVESMKGAPVFMKQDILIGIVRDATTVFPINHVTPYVTMAEGTIIGKGKIRELVLDLAKAESLMPEQQKKEWKQFMEVLEYVRMSTSVVAEIVPRQERDRATTIYSLEVKIERPSDIMYSPVRITATAYPEFSYSATAEAPQKTVRWDQSLYKSTDPQFKELAKQFVFKTEFPTCNSSCSAEIPLQDIKAGIRGAWGLLPPEFNRLKVEKLMVHLMWEVEGREGKRRSRQQDFPSFLEGR